MTRVTNRFWMCSQNLGAILENMKIGMEKFATSFDDLNKNLNEFGPLTEKLLPFIDNLDLVVEALQNNILLRKEIEKLKKEKGKLK